MDTVLLRKPVSNIIALEMIEYQNDHFGERLEEVHAKLQAKILDNTYSTDDAIQKSEEVEIITEMVFDRLGLKIDLVTSEELAAVLPFYVNKNHIFLHEFFRGNITIRDQEKIIRKANGRKGSVDTIKAKVSGIFSEYENTVWMNYSELFKTFKLSVPECVGILLHELGHAFYACEYSDRLETSNQILQNASEVLFSNKEKKDKVYVFRELEKVNPKVTEQEIDKMISGNRVIAGYTWFKVVVGTVQEQLTNAKYSETSFEMLADNFTSRFGYGRQVLLGLDKLHLNVGSAEKNKSLLIIQQFISIVAMSIFAILPFISVLPGLIGLYFIFIAYLIFRHSATDSKNLTYDDLLDRYKRIRNDAVDSLKNKKLSNDKVKDILEDIGICDRVMKDTYKMSSILSYISNFVFTSGKDAKNSIVEQQLIEELTHNELYVRSAQLANTSN